MCLVAQARGVPIVQRDIDGSRHAVIGVFQAFVAIHDVSLFKR
jgi:hypothetical protein